MKQIRNLAVGATVAAILASACSSGARQTGTIGGLEGRPRRLRHGRHGGQLGEDDRAHRARQHLQREQDQGQRLVHLRAPGTQGQRRRCAPARATAGRIRPTTGRSPSSGRRRRGWAGVVNEQVGTGHRPAGHAVHAHPARHRDAEADGRGARLSRQADRLRRHRRARQRPRGLGRLRPPGVGSVPARQDQPQLLDERAQLHDRPELRRYRQDHRPHARGPRSDPYVIEFVASVEPTVVHYGDITMTFLNNWYHADQRGTSLTYASAVAVEEKSVIDYNTGNPDGILEPGEDARAAPRSAGGDLPEGGHALLRQPVHRARRRRG